MSGPNANWDEGEEADFLHGADVSGPLLDSDEGRPRDSTSTHSTFAAGLVDLNHRTFVAVWKADDDR
jgi:hypothetical protein